MRTHSFTSLLRSGLLMALVLVARESHALRPPAGPHCAPRQAQAGASVSRSRSPRSSGPSSVAQGVARAAAKQHASEVGRRAGIAGLLDGAELAQTAEAPALSDESRAALEEMVAAATPPPSDISADLVSLR